MKNSNTVSQKRLTTVSLRKTTTTLKHQRKYILAAFIFLTRKSTNESTFFYNTKLLDKAQENKLKTWEKCLPPMLSFCLFFTSHLCF